MDKPARRIIEIDRDTIRLKEKTEEVIKDKKVKFESQLELLEKNYLEEGEKQGKKIYKDIIAEAKHIIDENERQTNKKITSLENLYNNKKKILVEELWQDLFKEE